MTNIDQAIRELKEFLGDRISTANSKLSLYGQNETYFEESPPDAVVFPETTAEVAKIVTICARNKCPVVPWGVGTSLEGHSLAIRGGVTIDMCYMNKVLAVKQEDLLVVVQPGLTRKKLNNELRATGLFFPVDPGADATLGGMAATRASGTTAVRYGTMRENVIAMEVVLADGRIIRTGTQAKKSSAGYDLTKLFIGSEGTLGIITELTLILHGQPEAVAAGVCEFETVDSAVGAVISAIQMGIPMARIELIDQISIRAINAYSKLNYPEKPHLFMEFHGSNLGVKDQSITMEQIIKEFGGGEFKWSAKPEERNRLWAARHEAYYATKAFFPGKLGMSTDVCVPISELANAITDTQADLEQFGVIGAIVGHVGDGNFHTLMFSDRHDSEDLERNKMIAHRMAERALAVGGTVTGEHGIGLGKMKYMAQEHGEALPLMVELKRTFDPQNIMNPGKMVNLN
ncbi:MAG: FAD-binding oxidoreductase [Paracoccaceae bacterium]